METGLVIESSFTMPTEIPDMSHEVKAVVIDENTIVESVTGVPISRGRSASKKALDQESYATVKQRPSVQKQQQFMMESESVEIGRASCRERV